MSEDRKIIEYDGESQWYQKMTSSGRGKMPVDMKSKRRIQISLPQENLLDVFKFLDFNQLLSFQHSSFYFKNIIEKYEKELARKKFTKLKFVFFIIYFNRFLGVFCLWADLGTHFLATLTPFRDRVVGFSPWIRPWLQC
ncbi:unnamed protein product [Meloidogyne enterolobii]|uniref:Uncharacterized protein n=1 Tax=Meloidogyne enterolobii TaxID=390850 RepID=A0ACB1B481_MELEN